MRTTSIEAARWSTNLDLRWAAAWTLVAVFAVVAYWPGLQGPFLFDDFAVLTKLGKYGGVVDWASFRDYVTGGTAGPSGRPVSLLSFLVDANNWPADAWPFKRTNLLIHVLTGSILAILMRQVLLVLGHSKKRAALVAALAAACWLLHPFLVSTTLYVVQRMAQLAALFVFAGLAVHLYGRSVAETNRVRGYWIMTVSIVSFTILATLSKENGALLPVLVGVLEITVLASSKLSSLDRRWAALFLGIPALLVAAFLVYVALAQGFFTMQEIRGFSVYERLLTQPRVLSEYLANWFIPKIYTTGVFQDHVIVSTGPLSPPATAIHLVLHVAAITAAIALRRRYSLMSFAVLFFYAGHLVESTTLSLEMYFEHRNYLSAAFLFLPILTLLHDKIRLPLFVTVMCLVLAMLAGFSRYSATVWSDYSSIVEASAHKAPMSARAQSEYAKILFNSNQYEESLAVVDAAIARQPIAKPQLVMTRLIILCKLSLLDDAMLERSTAGLSNVLYDRRLIGIYEEFALVVINGECPGTSLDAAHAVFAGMLEYPPNANPASARYSQIRYFMGLIDARNDNIERSVGEFEESLSAEPSVTAALNIAALLASAQYFPESLRFIERARALHGQGAHGPEGTRVYSENDIDELERSINDAANAHRATD